MDLLQLPTRRLLEKIGAGNHKPGSGSAAALNGILSCKLLMTVIELTLGPQRRKNYSHCWAELEILRNEITNVLAVRLEELFEEDSRQFDKTVQKRIERDKETNQKLKNQLHEESLIDLKRSTDIPLEIAQICIEVAKFSIIVFEKGFKSARGDSGVALGSAISGLTGCISIISLNLQSFPKNAWTQSIENRKQVLREEFRILSDENLKLMNTLDEEATQKGELLAEFLEIRRSLHGKNRITHIEIENLSRRIQNSLWRYKDVIWSNPSDSHLGVLRPEKVIELLRYAYHKVNAIGVNEMNEEIAGIINNDDATITISEKYGHEVLNFTSAHELGHALLHDKIELHRDLPLDGSDTNLNRPIEEIQADKFAAVFLMPKKLVIDMFYELFNDRKFVINEESIRSLANKSYYDFQKSIKSKREISRMIAKCEFYNFRPFNSMSKIFNVSIEAMAIRLEELELIEFGEMFKK